MEERDNMGELKSPENRNTPAEIAVDGDSCRGWRVGGVGRA